MKKYQHINKEQGIVLPNIGITGKDGIIETDKELNNPNFTEIKEKKLSPKK